MGVNGPVLVDEKVGDSGASRLDGGPPAGARGRKYVDLAVLLVAVNVSFRFSFTPQPQIRRFSTFFDRVKKLLWIIESESARLLEHSKRHGRSLK
jgi:hypothetical protein